MHLGWLNIWTTLVAIGVAIELLISAIEYAHEWRDFKRGTIRSPEKPELRKYGMVFIGVVLVVVGIMGEAKETAGLQKQADDALERLEDRRIVSEQSTELANRLRQFPPQAVDIVLYSDARDSHVVLNGIGMALTTLVENGWKVSTRRATAGPIDFLTGVMVTPLTGAPASSADVARAIVDKLKEWRIFAIADPIPERAIALPNDAVKWGDWANTLPTIRIAIGDKPPIDTGAYRQRIQRELKGR